MIDRDPMHLHPKFRRAVDAVLRDCYEAGFSFRLFEGFRSSHRQALLYSQGRTAPGPIVTYAGPGESHHQYGVAADLVGWVQDKWTWAMPNTAWNFMHQAAKKYGLKALDFEKPHIQLDGLSILDLRSGKYPDGGDDSWRAMLVDRKPLEPLAPKTTGLSEADILNDQVLGGLR